MGLFDWFASFRPGGKRKRTERLSEKTFVPSGAGTAAPPKILIAALADDKGGQAGKRLGEMSALGAGAGAHRKSLLLYPDGFLDSILSLSGAAVLVTYTMYVITRHALVYTVILCCFGLLRFIFRVKAGMGGDPTDSLLKDRQLFAVSLLWAVMVAWIVYR